MVTSLSAPDRGLVKPDADQVAPDSKDLRLKPSSIVFEKIPSFQNIPVEKIGLLKERPVGAPGS